MSDSPPIHLIQQHIFQGHLKEAYQYLESFKNAEFSDLWEQFAIQAFRSGELAYAQEAFELLLRHNPEHLKANHLLCAIYSRTKNYEMALSCLNQYIQLQPYSATAYLNRTWLFQEMGMDSDQITFDIERALDCQSGLEKTIFESCLKLNEGHFARFRILKVLVKRASDPIKLKALTELIIAYEFLEEIEQAKQYCQQALRIEPDNFWYEIKLATLHPAIYQSIGDIKYYREKIQVNLKLLIEKYGKKQENPMKNCTTPHRFSPYLFFLAYQGLNDVSIARQMGQFWEIVFEAFPKLKGSKKQAGEVIKIGFVSSFFRKHSVMFCYWSLLEFFSQNPAFEVTCLTFDLGQKEDEWTEKVRTMVQDYRVIKLDPRALVNSQFDILVYLDIGMESMSYLSAQFRFAPIQCVMAGHPVTTGSSSMDYFISSQIGEIEQEKAQTHYSETLVALKTMGVNYPKPVLPESYKTRAELGWPEDKNIYFCPMNLFKVHPEFDFILKDILLKDESGIVFLVHGARMIWSKQLKRRFKTSISSTNKRIQFMNWIPFELFFHYLYRADVILDTIHFGGGNTVYQTLAVGTPMVSWPSPFLRGRGAYSLYKLMGMMDCLADNHKDYATLAVKIATNKSYQQELRQKIITNHSVLFDNQESSHELVNFFRQLVQS